MSNARFNGVISGIGAGDTVDKIEIVWKAGAETEAAAQSGGRFVTYQSPTNDAMITSFQGAGQIVDIGTLSAGVTYTPSVRITEKRPDLTLVYGAWATGTPIITAPSAPTGISAQSGNTTLIVSWTPGTGATSSLIRWGTATGVYGSTTDPASSGYQITGLTNGVTTYYQVGSKNTAGITWSAEQTALSNASPVFSAQPTLQSATTTTATITYGTNDAELDHYKREISNNGGATWYDGTNNDEIPGTGKTATITGLTAGTSYTTLVKLTPLTGNLATVTSNSVSVLTLPSAPTISSVVPGSTQNVITINTVTGATSYNLYWTQDGSDPTTASTKITGAVSPYTHQSLTNGVTYKYKAEAVNSSGVSALGTVASGTPAAVTALSTGLKANGAVDLITAPNSSTATVTLFHGGTQASTINKTALSPATYTLDSTVGGSPYNETAFIRSTNAESLYTWDVKELAVNSNPADTTAPILTVLSDAVVPTETFTIAQLIANRKLGVGFYKEAGGAVDVIAWHRQVTTGTFYYYDGSTWQTASSTGMNQLGSGLPLRLKLQRDATNYIFTVYNSSDTVLKTFQIAIASVYNGSTPDYLVTGDAIVDNNNWQISWNIQLTQAK